MKTEKTFKELNQGYLFEPEVLLPKTFSENIEIDDLYTPIVFKSDE